MRKWLIASILAFLLVPTLIAQVFADNELGKAAIPCLCCLDIRVPDVPWYVLVIGLVLVVGFMALAGWCESKREQALQEERGCRKASDLYLMVKNAPGLWCFKPIAWCASITSALVVRSRACCVRSGRSRRSHESPDSTRPGR